MSRSCETGGKIECPKCKTSLAFDLMVLKILNLEAKCDRAKLAVKAQSSVDDDFVSDPDIIKKIEDLDRRYRECRADLGALLLEHREIRRIHESRQELKQRSQDLKEAEEKFLL